MGRFDYPDTGRIFRAAPLADNIVAVPTGKGRTCGFSRALAAGHTVEEMQREGFSLKMNAQGEVDWTVGKIQRSADAAQAKETGGMVALYPRTDIAQQLVVPGGEPLEDMHCTVTYLGQDVTGQDPTELIDYLYHVSSLFQPIQAKVFGSAVFNSTGDDPCVVYLVGGSPDLTPLFNQLKQFVGERYPTAAEQHDPWIPHITAAYGAGVGMSYEGPIVFDRLGLRWPGADQDFIL